MAPDASTMPEYTLMSLNMSEHGWILLNVLEYVWINCSDYARVLNMLQYSYNNIITIITVFILESSMWIYLHWAGVTRIPHNLPAKIMLLDATHIYSKSPFNKTTE